MSEEKKELSPFWYDKATREVYSNTAMIPDLLEILKRVELMLADKSRELVTIERGQQGRIGIRVSVPDHPQAEAKVARCREIAVGQFEVLENVYPRNPPDALSKTEKAAQTHYKVRNMLKKGGMCEQSR